MGVSSTKAAVLYEYNTPMVVQELELDPPKQAEVLVRIAASGICATDLHAIDHWSSPPLPIVLGHEGAGIVEAVGPGVTRVKAGDHVIVSLAAPCGYCFQCVKGKPSICENVPYRSQGGLPDGTRRLHSNGKEINHFCNSSSWSQYSVVPDRTCVKVRDDAPLASICLLACGAMTGIGAAINTAKVEPGSTVAVYGCGGVGLNVIQGSALAGAGTIIAVDILDNKLELARQFGATHFIRGDKEDPCRLLLRSDRHGSYHEEGVCFDTSWRGLHHCRLKPQG